MRQKVTHSAVEVSECTGKINAIYSDDSRFVQILRFGSMFLTSLSGKKNLYTVSIEYFFISHKCLYRLGPCWLEF